MLCFIIYTIHYTLYTCIQNTLIQNTLKSYAISMPFWLCFKQWYYIVFHYITLHCISLHWVHQQNIHTRLYTRAYKNNARSVSIRLICMFLIKYHFNTILYRKRGTIENMCLLSYCMYICMLVCLCMCLLYVLSSLFNHSFLILFISSTL